MLPPPSPSLQPQRGSDGRLEADLTFWLTTPVLGWNCLPLILLSPKRGGSLTRISLLFLRWFKCSAPCSLKLGGALWIIHLWAGVFPFHFAVRGYPVNVPWARLISFTGIYNGTKAALIQAGEGWRLELAPLGVRVITLITGGVATNFLKNLPSADLPSNSYYLGITEIIRRQPEKIPMSISPEAYSVSVVRQVEKGMTGKYWIGGGSTLARWCLWLFPQWVIVRTSSWTMSSRCTIADYESGSDFIWSKTICWWVGCGT
jgi:NAD(P)-dependent dehydrogenase (short-subunit alcohol dehydrogenase family)